MRGRIAAVVCGLALAAASAPAASAPGDVCHWGGTPDAQTGTFAVDPPLSNNPSPTDIEFSATGDLAGDDPRCTGTMTFEGILWQGASCRFFVNTGTVSGVDGVATYRDAGAADSQGFVYAPAASTVPIATFNALVMPTPQAAQACAGAGLSGGAFSSVVVWLD